MAALEKAANGPGARSPAAKAATEKAIADLAKRLEIARERVEVLGVQRLSDANDLASKQTRSAGWSIRLSVGETVYRYTVNKQGVRQQR